MNNLNNKLSKEATNKPSCLAAVMCWALISKNDFPKDKWLIIETSDKAHHIAYFSSRHEKWEANSKFGGEPKWWAEVPSAPCT